MFSIGLDTGDAKREVATIAAAMLRGAEDLISGSRKIMSRLDLAVVPSSGPFAAIKGFWSETDDYPVGDVRQYYSADLLSRLDREVNAYVLASAPTVLKACAEIVESSTIVIEKPNGYRGPDGDARERVHVRRGAEDGDGERRQQVCHVVENGRHGADWPPRVNL